MVFYNFSLSKDNTIYFIHLKNQKTMKNLIILLFSFMAFNETLAQTFDAKAVEAADKLFEESFASKNIEAMFLPVGSDCIFYGTDPTERWERASFRTMMENGMKKGMPAMQVLSREIVALSGGNSAVVIKKISWVLFKTELREIAIYEKQNDGWKMKTMSLNLSIPNQKTKALNEILGN